MDFLRIDGMKMTSCPLCVREEFNKYFVELREECSYLLAKAAGQELY